MHHFSSLRLALPHFALPTLALQDLASPKFFLGIALPLFASLCLTWPSLPLTWPHLALLGLAWPHLALLEHAFWLGKRTESFTQKMKSSVSNA